MCAKKLLLLILSLIVLIGATGVNFSQGLAAKSSAHDTLTQKITFQAKEDISLGKSGIFMPSSAWSANLKLTRTDPSANSPTNPIWFTQRWTEVSLYDDSGAELKQVFGINYIYFTLNGWERRAWDAGMLNIYQYDTDNNKWVVCPFTHLVANKNAPRGRLTCIFTKFGVFGLGLVRS